MREKIDCFLPCDNLAEMENTLHDLRQSKCVRQIYLMVSEQFAQENEAPHDCSFVRINRLTSSETMREMAQLASAEYILLSLKATPFTLGFHAVDRWLRVAVDADAACVYSDRYVCEDGKRLPHPAIDYQEGSIRDDFDLGQLLLLKTEACKAFAEQAGRDDYRFAGFYDLRLFLSTQGAMFHLDEMLYTEQVADNRLSGEKQFDYVDPNNREAQEEMERAATAHLSVLGAKIDAAACDLPDFEEQHFEFEATVIIPVFNREKTISDAIKSAFAQQTTFPFNVMVVDNHSTDDTTRIVEKLTRTYERLIHLIPERTDLGIGGCWNMAVNDERCGRFAVQLDSDDLYSSPQTLQRLINAFYEQGAAMMIGSYRLCDFNLQTIPPGLISHSEWTDENGPNNALRINGLGAPRAFFTPLLRQIQAPDTSYGEDYALGLLFSRKYKIGRIFDELYLCRRWNGNSDHDLSVEKQNRNNLYKDRLRTLEIQARRQMMSGKNESMAESQLHRFTNRQLEVWESAHQRFRDLKQVETRQLLLGDNSFTVQFNPARMVSTGAKIDHKSLAARPCFLCGKNRPDEQMTKTIDEDFELLINPFPILPEHYTIPLRRHEPQQIAPHYAEIYKLLDCFPELTVFYNGPRCGASAPDHAHFQAGSSGILPLQQAWQRLAHSLEPVMTLGEDDQLAVVKAYPCHAFAIKCRSAKAGEKLFRELYRALPMREGDTEPMMNIVAWRQDDSYVSVVFPRKKHRPDCYFAEGANQMLISPGALDMAGLIITPRKEDFERLTAAQLGHILCEMSISQRDMQHVLDRLAKASNARQPTFAAIENHREPSVSVGIVSAEEIRFTLNKSYLAKGEVVSGEQTVRFHEGGIGWNGNTYRELTFTPHQADASFTIDDVTIGVNFHWERKESQTFPGVLRLIVDSEKICAINELPVETYLESVISSEMSATASLELLKAHAVISRSWLLAQMEKRRNLKESANSFFSFVRKDDELIKWYDREDHTLFDVCADDHCQRYQGITKETSPNVATAIRRTRGQILMSEGEICDARFSKCCGGISEEYECCWEDEHKPYLEAIRDNHRQLEGKAGPLIDLTVEKNAEEWIRSAPEAFCHTTDRKILSQVLNDYDQETADFYRWKVSYTQAELKALIERKTNMTFGDILDLVPLKRGKSGRISRLKIVGSELTFTIGKELEIRRTLSESHLYSSAFVVDRQKVVDGVPQRFVLTGAGWGHGVGLCQIGAAVMGEEGYRYDEILTHYYHHANIQKLYE